MLKWAGVLLALLSVALTSSGATAGRVFRQTLLVEADEMKKTVSGGGILSGRYGGSDLAETIASLSAYHPFATADERGPWETLPAELKEAAVAEGEKLLGYSWPALPAALYMGFTRSREPEPVRGAVLRQAQLAEEPGAGRVRRGQGPIRR